MGPVGSGIEFGADGFTVIFKISAFSVFVPSEPSKVPPFPGAIAKNGEI